MKEKKTITEVDKVITKTCSVYSVKHGVASELWAQVQHRGACQPPGPAVSSDFSETIKGKSMGSFSIDPGNPGVDRVAPDCHVV